MANSTHSIFITVIPALGALLFGLDIGYIAPILECASFKRDVAHLEDWDDSDSRISGARAGLIVSMFSLGCIVAAFPAVSSHFLDVWGRRQSIILATAVFLGGCCIQAAATAVSEMLVGRFVTGTSIGLLSAAVPLYQSEIAPPEHRGALVSLYQLLITLGILVAAYLDMMWVPIDGGWRWAIWVQTLPAGLLLVCMCFLPASPRWLVTQDREDEALQVLEQLRGKDEAKAERDDIVRDHQGTLATGEPSWGEIFALQRVRQLLLLGIAMELLSQLVGMNAFMYFGPRIFRDLGLSENKFQTINNAVNFVSTFPAVFLADVLGRRFLLMRSAAGMTVACLIMGTVGTLCVKKSDDGSWSLTNSNADMVIAGSVFFFVFNFAYGMGPMVWVYTCEIFPLRYRSRCLGLCTTANWVGNWMVAQFTPMLLESLGFITFLIFGVFCAISFALFVWLPETKGVELEHIARVFDSKLGRVENAQGKDDYGALRGV